MQREAFEILERLIGDYFPHAPLNEMLRAFVKEKQLEESAWAEITTTAYRMFGGVSPLIHKSAAVTELIMLILDMIDDLQDRDNGQKPWMAVPEPYALNAALSLGALAAIELGAILGEAEGRGAILLASIGRLLAGAIHGQQLDIGGAIASEEGYIEMVRLKSGSLMQLACAMGYVMAEPPLEASAAAAMDSLALYAGMIAQLQNDLSDVMRVDVKNDLLNKKLTLPILFLLKGSPEEFPPLLEYYEGRLPREEFLALKPAILGYVESSGCIDYTRAIQHLYRGRAAPLLASLPVTEEWRERFRQRLRL